MSRTIRKKPYNWYRKEKKYGRKRHHRGIRHREKAALHEGNEPEPEAYRTSGWLTW